jgi:hypothetical protein
MQICRFHKETLGQMEVPVAGELGVAEATIWEVMALRLMLLALEQEE